MKMTLSAQVDLTPEVIARAFVEMDDDNQAKFFVECAKLMAEWPAHARIMQLHETGRHLASCECSTEESRAVVRELWEGIEIGLLAARQV